MVFKSLFSSSISQIQAAILALADEQKREIEKLLQEQAKQRDALQAIFARQQQELMSQFQKFQNVSVSSTDTVIEKAQIMKPELDISNLKPANDSVEKRKSPVLPTLKPEVEPSSLILPANYQMPEAAQTPENSVRFEKLSALIKGYLTRRLLKTEKVRTIVEAMKDIMTIALQLHDKISVDNDTKLQDVQLHARLLQQLQRESSNFHDIFFKIGSKEQMAIIANDRQIKFHRRLSSKNNDGEAKNLKKRVSSVTMAKLQQKKQLQTMQIYGIKSKPSPRRSSSRVSSSRISSRISSSRMSNASSTLLQTAGRKVRKTGVKPIAQVKPWK